MNIHKIIQIIEENFEIYEMLKHCPYEILNEWDIKEYSKGSIILYQEEVYDSFYIVVEGFLNIYIMAENGKRYSQAIYKKGDYIGELEIFDAKPFICGIEALSDVKLLEIKRTYFLKWIELDRNISSYIIKTLCSQFYDLSKKAGQDALYSLRYRVCRYLVNRAESLTTAKSFIEIDVNKEKLSEQMAVTQRSINRVLKHLKENNIIEIKSNSIIVKDIAVLKREEELSKYE